MKQAHGPVAVRRRTASTTSSRCPAPAPTAGASCTPPPRPGRPAGRTARRPRPRSTTLGAYEEFFAYPGTRLLSTLRQRIATGDAEGAAGLARRISEAILTRSYKHDTGAWEAAEQLAERAARAQSRDDAAPAGAPALFRDAGRLARRRRPRAAAGGRAAPPAPAGGRLRLRGGAGRQLRGRVLRHPAQPGHRRVTIYEGFAYASRHDAPALRNVLAAARLRRRRTSTATTWRWRSPPA